jgi:hypothetical protein
VTHNLSEGKDHEPRPYLRGSVRRASGFVLTGKPEIDLIREGLPTTRHMSSRKVKQACQKGHRENIKLT